ncbi:MAG: hypothetical protein B6D64_12975 [Bacteroidetes bacterium 4484_276]|nr:MAG: hypothetical protein B6D64_12975 [Bacteroidetes bacterium 4484_276]
MQSPIPKAFGNEGMAALALKEPNQGFHPFPLVRDLNPCTTGFKFVGLLVAFFALLFALGVSGCTWLLSLGS